MFQRLTNPACLAMSRTRSCVSSRKCNGSSITAAHTRNNFRDAYACKHNNSLSLSLSLVALSAAILCLGQISPALALSPANSHYTQTEAREADSASQAFDAATASEHEDTSSSSSIPGSEDAGQQNEVSEVDDTQGGYSESGTSQKAGSIPQEAQGSSINSANNTYGDFELVGDGGTVSFADPVLTIDGGAYTISMAEGVTSTSNRIELSGGATLTLNGIQIDDTTDGPAINVSGDQDVTILLADGSVNVLKGKAGTSISSNPGAPGIQKTSSAFWLEIGVPQMANGSGELTATGGIGSAGIGGGSPVASANKIKITAGIVTACGGDYGAGIGGGYGQGKTYDISISGGVVTAIGGTTSAGIGNGYRSDLAARIVISGGIVTATGGTGISYYGDGIGSGGMSAGSSDNQLAGDAVVFATSGGGGSSVPLGGFDATTGLVKGIAFTRQSTSGTWSSAIYGTEVAITEDAEFPANLTVGNGTTVRNEANLTFASGAAFSCTGTGKVETLLKYNPQGGSFDDVSDAYQLYQDASGVGKYQNLPQPTTNATFGGWFTEVGGQGQQITSSSDVQLNLHQVYADMAYTVAFDSQGGSSVAPVTDVTYEAKIAEPSTEPTKAGYTFDGWYKEAGCTNKWNFATDTVQGDTTLYAGWIGDGPTPPDPGPGPEPTPTPTPEPTPATDGSDILPVTGDTNSSALFAITLVGALVALTGSFIFKRQGPLSRRE